MADASDSFFVINDVAMASLLLLKVMHMLANSRFYKIPFFALYVYLDF